LSKILATVVDWFDAYSCQERMEKNPSLKTDWKRSVPFFGMHLMCLFVFYTGWSWTAIITAFMLYVLRMFAITGFYHRYFSHRSFKTTRWFQFVMALWGNTSGQRGPLWWAAHHRHHHAHSDDEDDLHSPHQHGFYWSHMGWITSGENFRTQKELVPDLAKNKELVFLDRFDIIAPFALGVLVFYFGVALNYFFPSWGVTGFQMLVWGFFVSTVLLFHGTCTINSLSHMIGTRRFATKDESRNSPVLAVVTLGEGWHNNHHHYPSSARNGFYWWEYDITYYGLWFLSKLGLIWDLRPVPERVLEAGRHAKNAPRTFRETKHQPAVAEASH